jgi:hypothetical protein
MADDPITPGEDVQTGDPTAAKPDKPIGIFQLDDDTLVKRLRKWLKTGSTPARSAQG